MCFCWDVVASRSLFYMFCLFLANSAMILFCFLWISLVSCLNPVSCAPGLYFNGSECTFCDGGFSFLCYVLLRPVDETTNALLGRSVTELKSVSASFYIHSPFPTLPTQAHTDPAPVARCKIRALKAVASPRGPPMLKAPMRLWCVYIASLDVCLIDRPFLL